MAPPLQLDALERMKNARDEALARSSEYWEQLRMANNEKAQLQASKLDHL
jgi:hypothetical protein